MMLGNITFDNVVNLISSEKFENSRFFSFEDTYKYEPCAMLLISSCIRRLRENNPDDEFSIAYGDNHALNYASHMGFFKSISDKINVGKKPGEASGSGTYIPLDHLYFNEKGKYNLYEERIMEESDKLAKVMTANLNSQEVLSYLIREMLRNSVEHSGNRDVWICAQRHEMLGFTEIAILDEGKGIKNSLNSNKMFKNIDSDTEAILFSTQPGISESINRNQRHKKQYQNSGYGLYAAKEICSRLDGSLDIVSGNKGMCFNKYGKFEYDTKFLGTAIRMKIKNSDNTNLKEMLEDILNEGENLASEKPYSMKTASTLSKLI